MQFEVRLLDSQRFL